MSIPPLDGAAPASASGQQDLAGLFALFDQNGDGVITAAEVERVLIALAGVITPSEAEGLRQQIGGQDRLERPQFLQWARQQPALECHQLLRELFALIDTDGSGCLSAEELMVILDLWQGSISIEELLSRLDRDGNGRVSADEFLALMAHQGELPVSLADLKRLKKTLAQNIGVSCLAAVGLVEVDCDLGAGIPGAGSGIELLKSAVQRQRELRQLSERLIAEIDAQQRSSAGSADPADAAASPHARHIETIAAVMKDAASCVAGTLARGLFPIVLAGDHSTAAATIAGIRLAHPSERLGVVWIDAHADIHSPFTTPSGNMHGMPLGIAAAHDNLALAINDPDLETRRLWRQLQELGGSSGPAIALHDLIYVAVRDTEPAEDSTIATHAIPVIRTEEVRLHGAHAAARRCLDHLAAVDRIYVSFDVDALDATICKGTGTPVPGGLRVDEVTPLLVALLADPRVCCWEICEINPHLDTLNTLAEVSLGIFQAGLQTLAQRFGLAASGHGC